jgi:hypothetical protein
MIVETHRSAAKRGRQAYSMDSNGKWGRQAHRMDSNGKRGRQAHKHGLPTGSGAARPHKPKN